MAPAVVRRMGLHDLPFVVAAHAAHFPEGFFVRLGPRFLTAYYRTFLDGPLACALVVERGGVRCGYLAGIVGGAEHRRLVMRYHGSALALRGVLGLVARPRLAIFFVRTRATRYARGIVRTRRSGMPQGPSGGPSRDSAEGLRDVAVLSHVVVTQSERCRGLGRVLVEEFLDQARDARCASARLVTSGQEDGAAAFYAKLGWTRVRPASTGHDRHLLQFEYDLGPVR